MNSPEPLNNIPSDDKTILGGLGLHGQETVRTAHLETVLGGVTPATTTGTVYLRSERTKQIASNIEQALARLRQNNMTSSEEGRLFREAFAEADAIARAITTDAAQTPHTKTIFDENRGPGPVPTLPASLPEKPVAPQTPPSALRTAINAVAGVAAKGVSSAVGELRSALGMDPAYRVIPADRAQGLLPTPIGHHPTWARDGVKRILTAVHQKNLRPTQVMHCNLQIDYLGRSYVLPYPDIERAAKMYYEDLCVEAKLCLKRRRQAPTTERQNYFSEQASRYVYIAHKILEVFPSVGPQPDDLSKAARALADRSKPTPR